MIDPYKTLGVNKSSSLEEIKASYKKLARAYHPDLNPGKKDSEEKFKEVAHAFGLIGTAEAKSQYDSGEIHEQRQKHQGSSYKETQDQSGRYSYEYAAGMEDEIFSSFFGRNRGHESGTGMNYPGDDELYHMEIDLRESAVGVEKTLTLPNGKKLQVQIPAGISSGQKLKFRGQGKAGIGAGPPGDGFIQITVKPSPHFKREGKDIISEVPISFFEAMSGAEVEVLTVDGKVMLTIPSGVSTGTKVRIKGKGAGQQNDRGHHLAVIKIVMPKNPPQDFKEAISLLEKQFQYNPRGQA